MTGLQTEFPYWSHLFTERIHVGKVIRPGQPAPLNSVAIQTANAKLMPKNGVQQMTKRPMTTATVVAMRKSWNKSNIVKLIVAYNKITKAYQTQSEKNVHFSGINDKYSTRLCKNPDQPKDEQKILTCFWKHEKKAEKKNSNNNQKEKRQWKLSDQRQNSVCLSLRQSNFFIVFLWPPVKWPSYCVVHCTFLCVAQTTVG